MMICYDFLSQLHIYGLKIWLGFGIPGLQSLLLPFCSGNDAIYIGLPN